MRSLRRALPAAAVVTAFAVYLGVAAPTQTQQKPRGPTDSCVDAGCHASVAAGRVRHEPAARGRCLDCHAYAAPEEHLFRLTLPRRELCGSCHAVALSSTVHAPVADGNCTGCHDPHASDHPSLLKGDPAGALCASCHDPSAFDKTFMHGPVAVGACAICHEPHTSSHKGLLTQDPKSLCVSCHPESAPTGAAARHEHRPMRDGCTTCHDPHASDARFQLQEEIPGLCFGCHQGVERLVSSSPIVHRVLDDEAQCTQCHSPHYAPLPALQRRAQPDLCLQCHDRPVETDDGRVLENMRALLAENPNHHGPIREGACTSCHQPHGADHFRLLLKEYPPEFYAPFDLDRYGLCFSCHLPDMVKDRSGTGLTGFREGDLNLHWLHVNQQKGRTCRACHEVHASQRPFHIRESVPFGAGGWMLEINFEQTPDGGTCTPACHRTKSYGRTAGGVTKTTGEAP